jgi:hypothetical protein
MAKKILPDITVALIGPNATVVDTEKSPAKLIVSGQSSNNPIYTIVFTLIENGDDL